MLTWSPSLALSTSSWRAAEVRSSEGTTRKLASLALIACVSPFLATSSTTANRPLPSSKLSTCAARPLRCAAPCSPCNSTRVPMGNAADCACG
eukprot:7385628-Prymnesium_polylepis.4